MSNVYHENYFGKGGIVGLPHTDIAHEIMDIFCDSNGDAWVILRNSDNGDLNTYTASFIASDCVILVTDGDL